MALCEITGAEKAFFGDAENEVLLSLLLVYTEAYQADFAFHNHDGHVPGPGISGAASS